MINLRSSFKKQVTVAAVLVFAIFALGFAFLGSKADAQVKIPSLPEQVDVFDATLEIQPDASVKVTEKIYYETGPTEHHGIYRDIRLRSAQNERLRISDISVTEDDAQNTPIPFTTNRSSNTIRLKIGDPDVTFSGNKVYIIKYTIKRGISYFNESDKSEAFDELYWNVTGNDWQFPIEQAQVVVILPKGVAARSAYCYFGVLGADNDCNSSITKLQIFDQDSEGLSFTAPRALSPGEGLTVAVSFPEGSVAAPSFQDKLKYFLEDYAFLAILFVIPLFVFIVIFRRWKKYGKDPKGTGVIVPQYQAPKDLTPLEVALLLNESTKSSDLSAEIISLAVRGYLKIKIGEKTGIFQSKSDLYTLEKLKEADAALSDFDQELLKGLFTTKDTIQLSDLKNSFYKHIPKIQDAVGKALVAKGYYTKEPKRARAQIGIGFGLIFVSFFFGAIIGTSLESVLGSYAPLGFIGAGVLSGIIVMIFGYFMPAKTEAGVAMKEYILGLKDYLQIAEKDRLEFHNAPEKKPETFEKLLPFAMILHVEKAWAKEFEGIYTTPPSWYEGPHGQAFNTGFLIGNLSSFNTAAASGLASSPSSSGSGGGGFSGGGGGGGGGGSW
jgi:ABC-type antimicrobial peptide transport system permease subunit/uncharacterized membrane protein YgcG